MVVPRKKVVYELFFSQAEPLEVEVDSWSAEDIQMSKILLAPNPERFLPLIVNGKQIAIDL